RRSAQIWRFSVPRAIWRTRSLSALGWALQSVTVATRSSSLAKSSYWITLGSGVGFSMESLSLVVERTVYACRACIPRGIGLTVRRSWSIKSQALDDFAIG